MLSRFELKDFIAAAPCFALYLPAYIPTSTFLYMRMYHIYLNFFYTFLMYKFGWVLHLENALIEKLLL